MIRSIKFKFILVVMISYSLVMGIIVGGINIYTHYQMVKRYDQILEIIVENSGSIPEVSSDKNKKKEFFTEFTYDFDLTSESKFEIRYFIVRIDEDGDVLSADISHISSVTEEDAKMYAAGALLRLREKGTIDNFRYIVTKKESEDVICFVDMYQNIQNVEYILRMSILLYILLFLIMLIILLFLSDKIVRPAIENMEKQKQFITDAGHELKTPLAVISADADVLELMHGKSEWIDSIRNQTIQMNELVKRLLFLSKMEEGYEVVMKEMNISSLVKDTTERISPIAVSQNKKVEMHLQDNLFIKADAYSIEHLVSVLTENALKYSDEGGTIIVKLYKLRRSIHLEVWNSGQLADEKNADRLFDRFYRPDSSRNSETGGHGIGLSMAKAVVISHKGKISARNDKERKMVVFSVVLPL